MRLIEGQLIHRRYRLDSRLAQGGMGEVWKGFDIQLGRPVAIKALRTDTTNQESKLRRLRAEARNSACVICSWFVEYETPKSVILTSPLSETMMFAGLTSRWITPCERCRRASTSSCRNS